MMNAVISVVLIDDHAVVKEGYKRLLSRDTSINVIGEADSGDAAYQVICELKPDVAVMDISLPGMSGIEVTRRVISRLPQQKILVFSMHEDAVFANRAFQAGAKGYLTKSSAPETLIEAVRTVAEGKVFISNDMAKLIAEQTIPGKGHRLDSLSSREFEIFRLLVKGVSLNEISDSLHLSYKTVANYQSNIRQKLDVTSAAQLVRLAIDHGVISGE